MLPFLNSKKTFIISEAGVNHNGSIELARKLIEEAANAGADAIKFQSFLTDQVVTKTANKADYQIENTTSNESQREMLKKLELSPETFKQLKHLALKNDILFLSSPFDHKSTDLLVEISVPAIKIGSGELTNLPFLKYIASKNLPLLLSTGMAYLSEVEEAVETIYQAGNEDIALLHCVSNYPANVEDANLKAIQTLKQAFNLPVGYSDHTLGIETAIAAVTMGACIIEKHLTLDKNLPGPDHQASLTPSEFKKLVLAIRNVEKAFGNGIKRPVKNEKNVRLIARRSLVSARDINAGEQLEESMITIKRPGTGIQPKHLSHVKGKVVRSAIPVDTVLEWEMLK